MADSEEIAELITHAELAVVRGAAHGFMVENALSFNRTVLDFLDGLDAEAVPEHRRLRAVS